MCKKTSLLNLTFQVLVSGIKTLKVKLLKRDQKSEGGTAGREKYKRHLFVIVSELCCVVTNYAINYLQYLIIIQISNSTLEGQLWVREVADCNSHLERQRRGI